MKLLISACLLGINCKYNGDNNKSEELMDFIKAFDTIPICPEQLGGLTTPRAAAEIKGGSGEAVLKGEARVYIKEGGDVTEKFIRGAKETLELAKLYGCEAAILKARSPSCGCGTIYDGSFSGKTIVGNGICTQLLLDNSIKVYSEENYKELQA